MQRPEQPPEGRVIAAALERSSLSIREASKRAGISYGRWRQVVSGIQNVSRGNIAPVTNVPAATIARMALAAGATPEEMEREGRRPDAAQMMRAGVPTPRPRIPDDASLPPSLRGLNKGEMLPYFEQIDNELENREPPRSDLEAQIWSTPGLDLDAKRTLVAVARRALDISARQNRQRTG